MDKGTNSKPGIANDFLTPLQYKVLLDLESRKLTTVEAAHAHGVGVIVGLMRRGFLTSTWDCTGAKVETVIDPWLILTDNGRDAIGN